MKTPSYVFFGTGHFALPTLQNLKDAGFLPSFIVTSPDKPVGRHQVITPPPVKVFADEHNIPTFQPTSLKTPEVLEELRKIISQHEAVVVADYGKIIPQNILDLSPNGFLNIHPSLLPIYRGPTPVQATILNNNRHTGVTIIKMDHLMDHGPIVAQTYVDIEDDVWPVSLSELYTILSKHGAELLIQTLPDYIKGTIDLQEQDHDKATYVKMIDKADSEVFPQTEPVSSIYLKFQAYESWPGIFFMHNGKRVKIKAMNKDEILRVTPEGKTELDFKEYIKYHPLM